DYHLRLPEFLGWIARRERAGSVVWNRADLLRWNCHKGYLRDLAARDVATVPTRWLARGEEIDLRALLADAAWQDAVVKPAVSAARPRQLLDDAERVIAAAPGDPVYARVDGVEREGRLVLMELELIEPHLFLGWDAEAADRLARAIREDIS